MHNVETDEHVLALLKKEKKTPWPFQPLFYSFL